VAPDNSNGGRDDLPEGFDGGFTIIDQAIDGDGGPSTGDIPSLISASCKSSNPKWGSASARSASSPTSSISKPPRGGIQIYAAVDGGTRTLIGQLQQFVFAAPASGDSMTLEIEVTSTDSFETIAVANVQVSTGLSAGADLGDPEVLEIGAIQGTEVTSPFEETFVQTTGIVTAVDDNKGFYLQGADGDGDDVTSDGIFVETSETVTVGDTVTGMVASSSPRR